MHPVVLEMVILAMAQFVDFPKLKEFSTRRRIEEGDLKLVVRRAEDGQLEIEFALPGGCTMATVGKASLLWACVEDVTSFLHLYDPEMEAVPDMDDRDLHSLSAKEWRLC